MVGKNECSGRKQGVIHLGDPGIDKNYGYF